MKLICNKRIAFVSVLASSLCFSPVTFAEDVIPKESLHIGPVDLHPHLEFISAYNDNVFLKSNNKQGDFSFITSPGLQMVYGQNDQNFITLDYTAAFERFVRLTSQDADNQFVKLNGHFEVQKLTIGVSHAFQDIKGANTQVGATVRSRDNITNLDLEYRISSKTSLGVGYSQSLHDYITTGMIDSQECSPYAALYYHMTPKSDLFCRFAYGWIDVDQGPDSTYQEADIGVRGKLTNKLTGIARVGYQHWSFTSGLNDINAFVMSADLQAQLTKRTTWTLGASRRINPSPVDLGNSYEATRVDSRLIHKLPGKKVSLWLGGAYEYDEYELPMGGTNREDNFFEVSAGVAWDVTKWMQLSAEYLFWENQSRWALVEFNRNLASIHARVHF